MSNSLPPDLSADQKRARLAAILQKKAQQQAIKAEAVKTEAVKELASQPDPVPPQPAVVSTAPNAAIVDVVSPLSYGQRALWFLHQSDEISVAYNVSIPARIQGSIDVSALREALQQLTTRHSTLRTTFTRQADGEPIQNIHADWPVCFDVVAAAGWSEDTVRSTVVAAHRKPFDLEKGPVFRATLFTQSAQSHILLLSLHHIVYDAWSIGPLLKDLEQLYMAAKAGTEAALTPLAQQFSDFVSWQNEVLSGAEGDRLWDYWNTQLAGDLSALDLPTDRPHPLEPSTKGATHTFHFTPDQAQSLKAFAQSQGTTVYTLLMAAFQSLLYRYTGQNDIVVGSPVGGRPQSEFESIVGYFVNPVAVKGTLHDELTFSDFLGQIRTTVLDAMEHHAYPFPLLVKRLQLKRDPSRSPIFQVLFNFLKLQNIEPTAALLVPEAPANQIPWADVSLSPFALAQQEGQFELTLEMIETADSLIGLFKYNADLFEPDTIERMAGHFQTLLAGIIANPTLPLAALPLLTPAEEQQTLVDWNATDVEYPAQALLYQHFEAQVKKTPDAIALTFEGKTLTYKGLNEKANQLAHKLRALGVGPNSLVGICVARSLELVIGLYGILKAGGAYVSLDPSYPADRLAYMIENANAPVLLTTQDLASQLPASSAKVLYLDQWETFQSESLENLSPITQTEDTAYVIYTSGSTGKPKGVMVPHQAIINRLLWMQAAYQLTPADRVLQKTPFSFDVSVWEFFWPTITGATLVIARPEGHKDRTYLAQLIAEEKITTLHFVPSMLDIFLGADGLEQCSSLKRVICSGEALSADLRTRFFQQFKCELHNLYGPTEAAVDVTYWQCQSDSIEPKVPIGRPVANTQMYILNSALNPVPIGVAGELHIGGVQLARGYHNRPDLTNERFITHEGLSKRLYKTGDLCCYRRDGNIEYIGRIDHQVKLRGFRIELGEIENALLQHAAVQQCVVVAREDDPGNQYLAAYCVPMDGVASFPKTRELRQHLQQSLPDYMVPAMFVSLEVMPLTPSGKVNRRALPKPVSANRQTEAYLAPTTTVEKKIADIWSEILKLDKISITDDFFEIGGHSLLAVQAIAQMERRLAQKVSLAMLFRTPTVKGLAQALTAPEEDVALSLITYKTVEKSSRPPFFFIDSLGSFQKVVPYLAELAAANAQTHETGSDYAIYGITPFGPTYSQEKKGENPHDFIREMAACLLKDIKKVAPEGPYYFCSFCRASKLTWEISKQLIAEGESVEKLILIDSVWGPQPSTRYRHWENLKAIGPSYLVEKLQYLPKARYKWFRRRVLSKFRRENEVQPFERDPYQTTVEPQTTPVIGGDDNKDSAQLLLRYYRAIDGYRPEALPVSVDLFLPQEFLPLNHTTMEEKATAGLRIQVLPGYHHSLFSRVTQIKNLAEKLSEIIE